jgi:predicted transcriptional regulator
MSRLTLDVSPEIDKSLTDIAKRSGITKTEAMRRAFALLKVADRENSKGNGYSLGVVRENGDKLEAVARVVGIF